MKSVRDKQAAHRLEVFVILKKGERIATIHVHRGHTGKRQVNILHVGTTYGEQSAWGPNEPSYVELMAGLYVDGNRMYLPNVEPPELTQLLEEYHRAHARMLTTCDPGGAPKSNDAADKILRRAGAIGASIGGTAPFDPKTGERLIWRDRSVFRVEGAPFEDVWYTGYAHCTFLPGLDRIRALGYVVWKVL